MAFKMYIATIQVAVSAENPDQAADWICDSMREAGFTGHPHGQEPDSLADSLADWQYAMVHGQRLLPTEKYIPNELKDYEEGEAFNS
tara:strand:- start:417 stop:677 length:261 start_codon:yes stop_codon:yes gene_type:complete